MIKGKWQSQFILSVIKKCLYEYDILCVFLHEKDFLLQLSVTRTGLSVRLLIPTDYIKPFVW